MATSIRDINKTSDNTTDAGNRYVFNLSNGHVVALIRDEDGGGTQHFYLYETSDRVTWTLRATVDMWSGGVPNSVTATCDASNNIHIVALATGKQDLRYKKVTYSDWSQSGWQAIESLSGDNVINDFDVEVTDAGNQYITAVFWNGPGSAYGFRLYTKVTGAWTQAGQFTAHTNSWVSGCETISIVSADTAVYSGNTYDQLFIAFGRSNGKKDSGVGVYRPDVDVITGTLRVALSNTGIKTYAAAEGNPKSTRAQGRLAKLFRNPDNDQEVYLGIMHSEVHRKMYAIRLNVPRDQQAIGNTEVTFNNPNTPSQIGGRYMGMTISGHNLMFLYGASVSAFPVKTLLTFVAAWDIAEDKFDFTPRGTWYLKNGYITNQSITSIASGGQRNGSAILGDVLFQTAKSNSNRHLYAENVRTSAFQAPSITYPASGSDVVTSTPTLQARIKYADTYFQSQMSVAYQVASDSGFTTDVIDIPPSTWTVVDKANSQTGQAGLVSGVVSTADAIVPNVLTYVRARDVDVFGNTGPWSVSSSFTVSHPPSATGMVPSDGDYVALLAGDKLMFKWTFVDPSSTDSQSAYQIVLIKNSDGSTILDTGKIVSSDNSAIVNIPSGHIDEDISWEVTLWDSYDTEGPVSGRVNFKIELPPTITITSPTTSEDVGTPVPHIEFTVDTSGDATVKSYRVLITQGRSTLWDSGTKIVDDPSGTTYTVDGSTAVFHNLGKYSVVVVATDSRSFQGTSSPTAFSASWTPPAMPTSLPVIDLTHYNVEGEGYVVITWDDSGKDPNFAQYVLQRQANLLDSSGDIAEYGDWVDAATIYENDTDYEYHDYMAPGTNYQVGYRLVQGATVFNDVVYSDPGPAAYDNPQSDSYWIVDPVLSLGGAFRLFNVTADSYNVEYETETYHVIGRGNHTDYGDRLGYNGSLVAQLRNSGSTTARQKKQVLEDIKELKRPLYLRTPFGDVKLVSVGDLQVTRIAGVGIDEFCDVTVPYQEVGG